MARITQQSSIHTTGVSYENEPIIKSDAASSDVMEWAASTGTSSIKIRENAANDLVLDVEGGLELADRIALVTSSTTIGAVFLYDTSQDSDGGKWRKKCKGLSWFDEASSATRSARSEFPAMALIVADNVSANNETVTVYDLDDPAMPVWMVFQAVGSLTWPVSAATAVNIDSLYALNGRLYVGSNYSLIEYNFVGDDIRLGEVNPYYLKSGRTIASRNAASSYQAGGDGYAMVNANVNDVAATVLEGAEIGALGLPIPTVAVATAGGLSVIHANGSVYDSSTTGAMEGVDFLENGKLAVRRDNSGSSIVNVYDPNYWADSFGSAATFVETAHGSASSYIPNFIGSNPVTKHTGKNDLAIGTESGLNLYKYNEGNPAESAVAYVTSDYTTGWMCGDIRLAALTKTNLMADRSVKGNTLTENGSLNASEVASGAEQYAIYGFSSSNYLSRAYDADFDFSDGKFSAMCWVKVVAGSAYQAIINRYDAGGTGKGWQLLMTDAEKAYLFVYGASNVSSGESAALSDGWHFICGVSDGAKIHVYVDGVVASSGTLAAGDLTNSSAPLNIGIHHDETNFPQLGSLALARVSATAPTPQQIKEIYEAEKPLFQANAKCTIGGNTVNDLAYDKSSGLLYVCNSGDSCIFRGLEYIEELTRNGTYGFASGGTIDLMTAAGGVHAASRTSLGVGANLPALDVRAELNEGEGKLPDDGKLHFEGVTTDATPTVIAYIPMELYSTADLVIKGTMQHYQTADSGHWGNYQIRQRFYRQTSGAIARAAASKLVDEGTSTLDVTTSTSGNYITVSVTGAAGARLVWNASVEVQRISDKQYER
jgi:hypothetical protein